MIIIWDIELQIDHLISAKRPDLKNTGLYRPGWPQGKTKRKRKEKINTSTLLENWKKQWDMKVRSVKSPTNW